MFVLLMVCVLLAAVSRSVAIAAGDPMTDQNSVHAVVAGPAPTTPPAITNITQGAVYINSDPVSVNGTCPADTLVKIFKNEVLSGAVLCQNSRFSVQIDLFLGTNTLIVRAYNNLNVMGPESAPVVVSKTIPGINPADFGKQFFVTSDIYYKGVNAGEALNWPLVLSGGQAPYAVSVAWGDGKTDLISRGTEGSFTLQHTYQKPGNGYKGSYDVTIISTDAVGNKSFIHLVSVVGGEQPGIAVSIKQGYDLSGTLRVAWQVMLVALLLVLSFWLGERRELRLLTKGAKTA